MGGLSKYTEQPASHMLSDDRRAIIDEVSGTLIREFTLSGLRNRERRREIQDRASALVNEAARKRGAFSTTMLAAMTSDVISRTVGLGFLDRLIPPERADLVEIALVPTGELYVKRKGGSGRFEPIDLRPTLDEVMRVVDTLLAAQNKSLTEATPTVDAKLPRTDDNPGGGRVKVLHPALVPGRGFPAVSIRLFEPKPVLVEQIVSWGSATPAMMDALVGAVKRNLRILIAGGTGTGKTTLLAALCNAIPQDERILKIEDPEEIFLDKPHVVTMEARAAPPGSPVPPYTVSDAVNDAMRMNPDRLIVGEVRTGGAALALFRAQMSDHPGLSTFHAENPQAAINRLAVIMWADAGVRMEAAKGLFASAVDVYVQLNKVDGQRCMTGIWQIEPALKSGDVAFTPIFNAQHERVGEITRERTA
ncbi:MAG TPA: ATPase, T2SS/T4P/T4SS family [Anaerolineae bacterium]|nr:ATPase, T2SS/T4P/T4SS family [Anaerolineae bacterium]